MPTGESGFWKDLSARLGEKNRDLIEIALFDPEVYGVVEMYHGRGYEGTPVITESRLGIERYLERNHDHLKPRHRRRIIQLAEQLVEEGTAL